MILRAALAFTLLVFAGATHAAPKIPLKDALRLAEEYVAQHQRSLKDRYMESISWHEDHEHPENSCWSVAWNLDVPGYVVSDGLLVVWVCANGKIRHADSWA
jgi:hypothetical protein